MLYTGPFLDEERCLVVRRDDVGGPYIRSRDAVVVADRRRGGRQLRALVQLGRPVVVRPGGRAGPADAVSSRDLRPAARVLAARRGTTSDIPRGPHVPPPQKLRLQPARRAARRRRLNAGQARVEVTEGAGRQQQLRVEHTGRDFGAFVRLVWHIVLNRNSQIRFVTEERATFHRNINQSINQSINLFAKAGCQCSVLTNSCDFLQRSTTIVDPAVRCIIGHFSDYTTQQKARKRH